MIREIHGGFATSPRRIDPVRWPVHLVLTGDRDYLRALRAAEMVAWEAGLPASAARNLVRKNKLNSELHGSNEKP